MNKVLKGAIKYLKMMNFDILDENFDGIVVARDRDDIVIISVYSGEGYFPDDKMSMKEFEEVTAKYLQSLDDVYDVNIRYDIVSMNVLSSNRAFLRHAINVDIF